MIETEEIKQKIKNPRKTNSMSELGAVNILAIREKILMISDEEWNRENEDKPNKFKEFHSTKHIVFKFVKSFSDCRTSYEFPVWKDWEHLIQPALDQAVKPYGYHDGIFSRIMLARLNPKSKINVHRDGGNAATFPHKIHIPIQTNPQCTFFINPKIYTFEEGRAYEVNNLAQHFVENKGEVPRIHLIFEYFSESLLTKAMNDSLP